MEDLGGARTHNTKSGVAHYMATDEEDASTTSRRCCPTCRATTWTSRRRTTSTARPRRHRAPTPSSTPSSRTRANQPYDMHTVIEHVLDDGEFLEVQALFAPNIIARLRPGRGPPVGIVANQPMQFAGTLDIDASEKAARFVRTCDAFNVPVLTFVDVPGFLPGTDQEWHGIIRRGAKLIYAYAEATVPKVTVITRKAYGGAYDVMGSKHLGADINLAWPTAQIAVMGAQGAVNILHRRELAPRRRRQGRRGATGTVHHRVRGHLRQPLHRCRARLRRRGDPAVSTPAPRSSGRCGCCAPSASRCRRRSTGTSRCERHPGGAGAADGRGVRRGRRRTDAPGCCGARSGPRSADAPVRLAGPHRAGARAAAAGPAGLAGQRPPSHVACPGHGDARRHACDRGCDLGRRLARPARRRRDRSAQLEQAGAAADAMRRLRPGRPCGAGGCTVRSRARSAARRGRMPGGRLGASGRTRSCIRAMASR